MKNNKFVSIIYIVIILMIYIMFSSFAIYERKQEVYDTLSNNLYFDNILLIDNTSKIDWEKIDLNEEYRVYLEINQNCRLVVHDSSNEMIPLLKGEYPYKKNGQFALIGKNIFKQLKTKNKDITNINYNGKAFKISGIIGAQYMTSCDDLILLFDTKWDKNLSINNYPYIVDLKTKSGMKKLKSLLNEKYPKAMIKAGSIKGTARLTRNSYFFKLFIIELFISSCFSLFFFYQYKRQKLLSKYYIYYINGISQNNIILDEIILFVFINFVLNVTFIIASIFFHFINWKYIIIIGTYILMLSIIFECYNHLLIKKYIK